MMIKKPMMKFLGIEELISEYEHHCHKMSIINPSSTPQENNRYESQKTAKLNRTKDTEKQMQTLNKIYTNKNLQFNHYYHHNTLTSDIRKYKSLKSSQSKKAKEKSKNAISMMNFTKNSMKQQQSFRKTSLKNYKNFISIEQSLINSQTLIKLPSKHDDPLTKIQKQQLKNPSDLSLKDKMKNKNKLGKDQFSEIDLDNPTLAGINRKIKQFENKASKKDQKPLFRKSIKPQVTQCDEGSQQQRVKTERISEVIDIEEQDKQKPTKKKQFIPIDTNYYGFSFKNKISLPEQQPKIQHYKEQNFTIHKSNQDSQMMKTSAINSKKTSKSTSKIQISKKPYSTLMAQKNTKYQSSLLLKNKKPNSSLLLKPKLLLKDRYQLIKVIGRGMSGEVYQAKDILSDRFVAIKEIDVNSIEYEFFRQIAHQNVIKYYNNFVENGKRYLVLEYFPMTLKDLVIENKKNIILTEQDMKHIFRSIFNGLSYLHSLSIAHRDIKLDNIVISEDLKEIKFIDFGLCIDLSKISQELSKQFCGTLSYLPPEIVQGQPHQPRKADVWSLGIVLYGISLGRLPFKGKNQSDILNKICKSKPIYPQNFNPDLKELIEWMLEKNPSKRCTVTQIINHTWLN